jgi:hypothetical protein
MQAVDAKGTVVGDARRTVLRCIDDRGRTDLKNELLYELVKVLSSRRIQVRCICREA